MMKVDGTSTPQYNEEDGRYDCEKRLDK